MRVSIASECPPRLLCFLEQLGDLVEEQVSSLLVPKGEKLIDVGGRVHLIHLATRLFPTSTQIALFEKALQDEESVIVRKAIITSMPPPSKLGDKQASILTALMR